MNTFIQHTTTTLQQQCLHVCVDGLCAQLVVPHDGLVALQGVTLLPAAAAEVLETHLLPAEVRPLLQPTHLAQGVGQVWVHLHLWDEQHSF